jgi:hypothetical protein
MATGAEATEYIAQAVGVPHGTVARLARILRDADRGLWPRSVGRGGGKNAAHVQAHHLVNLALALALAGDQLASGDLTDAPSVVQRYSALVAHEVNKYTSVELPGGDLAKITSKTPLVPVTRGGFFPSDLFKLSKAQTTATHGLVLHANTLGEVATALVQMCTHLRDLQIEGRSVMDGLRAYYGDLSLWRHLPLAMLHADNNNQSQTFTEPMNEGGLLALMGNLPGKPSPRAQYKVTTDIPFEMWAVLAELYADTLAHERRLAGTDSPILDGLDAPAETTTPAATKAGPALGSMSDATTEPSPPPVRSAWQPADTAAGERDSQSPIESATSPRPSGHPLGDPDEDPLHDHTDVGSPRPRAA